VKSSVPGARSSTGIIEETGVEIDIEDDGRVFVSSPNSEAADKAIAIIQGIANDPEPGQVFEGRVTRLMNFGAFVEFLPGKEGLVHISKLSWKRVEKVEDVVSEGDLVKVKVMEIDGQGRINLSMRDCMDKPADYIESDTGERRGPMRDRGDHRGPRDSGDRGPRGGDRGDRRPRPQSPSQGHSERPQRFQERQDNTATPEKHREIEF